MPTGNLPASGKKLWEEVYDKALKGSCKGDKGCAAGSAWKAVKNAGWVKDKDGKWHKKAFLEEQFLTIKKAYIDSNGERRWRADTSNTDDDLAGDNMTLDLFCDFVGRIENQEPAPEEYRSNYWEGGMPYLSISHYPDLDGEGVPGVVDAVYIDGKYLKAKGRMNNTPLGDACWKAITEDLDKVKKGETVDNRVRVSIGFLDYGHKHKSDGFMFDRKSLEDICPECLKEILEGEYPGKAFYRGLLVHFALTRVPMNPDTSFSPDMEVTRSMTTRKEDAESIIGEEEAKKLDEKAKLVGKSEAFITKADDEEVDKAKGETCPDCGSKMVNGKCPKCDADEMEEEGCKAKKKKSDTEVEVDFSQVYAKIDELKASITAPQPKPTHILDRQLENLKARYDEIALADISSDEKLKLIQQPFNELGEILVSNLKSTAKEEPIVENRELDIVKAFSEALQPLAQKLDLLIQQGKTPVQNPVNVPQRRSFDPALVQQAQLTYSNKPMSIDEIARRSVGLS
jgi:cation transport regulator ChaB